ncbi:hypothetical protein NA78x_002160 [Anatilimnocola sp. NA78]|uniref:hypothetical protein n=1 Tax=Anatilimnocola sp. NA78 TaxID=3415683 RepID=UPI003CE58020
MSRSMRWIFAALAAGMMFGLANEASAQIRANVRVGDANVRVGGNTGYRLYGRRPWFANDGVRRQLKIDDNQYQTLNKTYVQYWTPYNQAVVSVPADLDEAERQRRISAAYGTFHQGYYDNTAKVFVDADARNRYNQLNLQYQGYAAFNDPQVQTRLKLTDEQRQNFNRYYIDWNKQMNTYATEYARDRDGVSRQFGDQWKQSRARINETLTPEQRRTWNEMVGEPHDFSADVYFDEGEDARDDRRDDRRDNPRRDDRDAPRNDTGRDNPPRNPAPGAGPRENPPRNPAPGEGPRENPPRNPRAGDREPAPRDPAPREPAPANPR